MRAIGAGKHKCVFVSILMFNLSSELHSGFDSASVCGEVLYYTL